MYALHIANRNYSSWSLRPWLLLRELDIDFDERLEVFGEGSNREAFRRFSPSGLVPCLIDDGLAVWDSLAVTEYLAERHAGVWPDDSRARAWARCAAAEMHSGFSALRGHCPMNCGVRARLHATPAALRTDLQRIDELWSDGLSRFGGPYLAGDRFLGSGCVLCTRRVPRTDLRAGAGRACAGMGGDDPRTPGDAGMV
jgi:glutathione S-transferase